MSLESSTEESLSVREKLCYGLGDVANGLALSSVTLWLLIYLTDIVGLGAFLAGVAVAIGRLWDAVTDPIMGWITDHTKSRWGKRRPYLLFGAIPYAIAYLALWMVPEFETERAIFLYVTIALILFNTCLTVVFVPYTSLTAAITTDYNERTSLTGYRMVSTQTAFLVGAALPAIIVEWVVSDSGKAFLDTVNFHVFFGDWAGTPREGYVVMALLFTVFIVASIWSPFLGTRERDLDEPIATGVTPWGYASKILNELVGNRPYLMAVLILLFSNCAATLAAVNLPYFIQYAVDLKEYQTQIISTLFITAILCVPMWVAVAKRKGKAETYRMAMFLYMVVLCSVPFIGKGDLWACYAIALFGGICHSAALTLPWAIIPDVVEYDELKSGKRREGLFYGGTTFSYKMATGLAFLISAAALELINYVPNEPQTDSVILGIKMIMGPAPAVFLLLGALLAFKYPLTQERHKEILKELADKKAKAPKKNGASSNEPSKLKLQPDVPAD